MQGIRDPRDLTVRFCACILCASNTRIDPIVLSSYVLAVSTSAAAPAPRWYVRPNAGQVLRCARKERGLTQRDLGLLLGQPLERAQSYVSKLEAGQLGFEAVFNAATALQLDVPDVMELRPPM